MRLHTNTISRDQLYAATKPLDAVYVETATPHGSRKRDHAYEIALRGFGARHTRRPNSGQYGADADDGYAATYDDWGWFIAALFAIDPDAIFGPYNGRDDFHAQTNHAYYTRSEVTA